MRRPVTSASLTLVPRFEDRMDDITAVLSATHVDRTALFGFSEGGALASLFAATHPERVSALVLYAANAKCTQTEDYPWGYTPEQAKSLFIARRGGGVPHGREAIAGLRGEPRDPSSRRCR